MDNNPKKILSDKFKQTCINIGSVLLNVTFLVIWLSAQSYFELLSDYLTEDSVIKETVYVFKWVFLIATLLPIVIYIVKEILIILIRAVSEVRDEYRAYKKSNVQDDRLITSKENNQIQKVS